MGSFRASAALMVGWLALLPAAWAQDTSVVTVFAAASMTNALQDLGDMFTRESAIPVRFSFASSAALARQIETGAPADLFVSADTDWMDYLQQHHLIQPASRHDLVGNELVLIAPATSTLELKIAPHFALAAALGRGRLAIGDPDSVPAGRYARQALDALGVWSSVEPRTVNAESVRAALAYVDRGEAALGIVYETDALIDKNVRVVDVFPADTHAPIVYPAALTRSASPEADRFLRFLRSPAASVIFKEYGFLTPKSAATP